MSSTINSYTQNTATKIEKYNQNFSNPLLNFSIIIVLQQLPQLHLASEILVVAPLRLSKLP